MDWGDIWEFNLLGCHYGSAQSRGDDTYLLAGFEVLVEEWTQALGEAHALFCERAVTSDSVLNVELALPMPNEIDDSFRRDGQVHHKSHYFLLQIPPHPINHELNNKKPFTSSPILMVLINGIPSPLSTV